VPLHVGYSIARDWLLARIIVALLNRELVLLSGIHPTHHTHQRLRNRFLECLPPVPVIRLAPQILQGTIRLRVHRLMYRRTIIETLWDC
jgi:hypothetical protein